MNFRRFKKNLKNEFNETFKDELVVIEPNKKERRKFSFKPLFAFSVAIIWGMIIVQHIAVEIYNSNLEYQKEKIVSSSQHITKIDSTKDIKSQLNYFGNDKQSILEVLSSISFVGCSSGSGGNELTGGIPGNFGSDTSTNEGNSYNTNIQEEGIDEADTVKCDGKYIYSVVDKTTLHVYDLTGVIVDSASTYANELYVYEDKIACIGDLQTNIFKFDGNELNLIDTIKYGKNYTSSRLINNELYIVVYKYLHNALEEVLIDDLYYDNCINPGGVIELYKYNLDTKESNSIGFITAYSAILYASENNFYIASSCYSKSYYTFISIIDYNLNPIGSVTVEGVINNQFSMDEHNNYLRVVSTDRTKGPLNINQISIFNLDTLERVGYLNEGIGLENHTVRSVRYDGDTCYVVTYLTEDPLYEIDLSDVTNPKIVSIYESPGYSTYLHTFTIDGQKYALGIGYDDNGHVKISVYIDNGNGTIQIGKSMIFVNKIHDGLDYNNVDFYLINYPTATMALNHKSIFIYNDNQYLYIGGNASYQKYTIFKIDVTQEKNVITIYEEYDDERINNKSRCFLVDGKIYIVGMNKLIIDEWS
jgi:uncharacterized secreted protein with C-terminal beta-propeller domain